MGRAARQEGKKDSIPIVLSQTAQQWEPELEEGGAFSGGVCRTCWSSRNQDIPASPRGGFSLLLAEMFPHRLFCLGFLSPLLPPPMPWVCRKLRAGGAQPWHLAPVASPCLPCKPSATFLLEALRPRLPELTSKHVPSHVGWRLLVNIRFFPYSCHHGFD